MTSCHFANGSWLVTRMAALLYRSSTIFHEIASLIGIEAVGAPIVEDQEIGSGEGPEQAGVAAVGAPHFQFGEHPWDALVEDGEVVAAGLLAERAGEP